MTATRSLQFIGIWAMRYSVVLILLWYGIFKFTLVEAEAISGLIENSPLMSWLYRVLSIRGASKLIGSIEIIAALLLAFRPFSATLGFCGSVLSTVIFLCTVSFLFTTPGSFAMVEGLVVPAGGAGFIVKDLVLLGFSLWSAGEAWVARATQQKQPAPLRQTSPAEGV